MQPRVAILGAGIAGLAAAAACEIRHISYQLFDPSEAPLVGGAALTLWPNALIALAQLGVLSQPPDWMHFIQQGDVRTDEDASLYALPLAWLERRYGYKPTCVRRVDLAHWLWKSIGKPSICRDGCTAITSRPDGVIVQFASGERERFDGVIAADGIHSVARRQLSGRTERGAHYTAWRGIATTTEIEAATMREYWGPGVRFGYASIHPVAVYWFATLNNHMLPMDEQQWWPKVVERLGAFPREVQTCLGATPAAEILRHAVRDVTPGGPLMRDNLVLVGDAAHAITPNLGLGACLALEDAAALADCIDGEKPLKVAFQQYAVRRRRRVARIAHLTRGLGTVTQWENAQLSAARNRAIRTVPSGMTHLAWRILLDNESTF